MATKRIFFLSILSIILLSAFISASSVDTVDWDKYMTKYYEERFVLAKTSGFSDGTSATIEIWEDDGSTGPTSDDDFIESFTTQVKNNRIISKWGGGDGSDWWNNAEYYAKVKLNGYEKSSWDLDFKANGNLAHNQGDCDFDYECQNKLYCEGIPATSAGGGGFDGDGCCYDYENWNVNQNYCNYAIKGQIFNVVTNSNGRFNSNAYPNINLFFVVYDDSSLLGRILGSPAFVDYVKADSNGNFQYNPEFNRQNVWNSNILFDWNVEVFALDENNNVIAKWTNSYTNDNERYKKGLDYVDQRVRIHTDKPYWQQVSNNIAINKMSSLSVEKENDVQNEENIILTDEQKSQVKLIKNKINLQEDSQIVNQQQKILKASSVSIEESNTSETEEYQEEVLYNFWEGALLIDEESEYYFNASIIGGYKLDIDGTTLIDSLNTDDLSSKSIYLEKGEHNLTIEYVHLIDRDAPNLLWSTENEENFELIPSSVLLKRSFNYQFYQMNLSQEVIPIEKFNEEEKINSLTSSANSLSSKTLSASSTNSNYYQVSFLEAPRSSLKTNNEPLILIHGLNGESGYFDGHFEDNLITKGYDVWKFYYPNDQKIDYSGALLSDGISYVKSFYSTSKVKVVSHSMGGLVTRSYIEGIAQDPNGKLIPYNNDISKFVMVAPPNYGSYLANRVLYDEDMGLICSTLNDIIGRIISGKSFMSWNKQAPAYTDLALGSEFIWKLNSRNTTSGVDMLVIAGKSQSIPCIPYEADYSDDLVSISSASRLNLNVPLILLDRNHLTIYKQLGGDPNLWELIYGFYSGNVFLVAKNIINTFVQSITDISSISEIINQFLISNKNYRPYLSSGEIYLNPLDPYADSNQFTEGGALIKINGSLTGQIKIVNGSTEYYFTQNPQSKIFYHFNYNENAQDYGSSIPKGNYKIYFNGQDTGKSIEIKPTQNRLYELNICISNLINTTWNNWQDVSCLTNNKMNQTRFRIGYDLNNCGTFVNQTIREYRATETCNYCSQNIQGPSYTSWSTCNNDLRTRIKYWKDTNYNSCCALTGLSEDCQILTLGYQNVTEYDSNYCFLNLTLNSQNNLILDTTKKSLIINSNQVLTSLEYQDLLSAYPTRWNRLCSSCQSYSGIKTFGEGNHSLIIKGSSINSGIKYLNNTFFIDSKDPQISTTKPSSRKYTNGSDFYIKYTEDNCRTLRILINGQQVYSNTCQSGKNIENTSPLDISSFNGQEVEYKFLITDIANNTDESRPTKIKVDTTAPEIKDFTTPVIGRYVYFNMTILNEDRYSFNKVEYFDSFDGTRARWKSLCTSLKNNNCYKKVSFSTGSHNLIVRTTDDAGNSDTETLSFTIA